eukprot:SAG11_NODE_16_length_26235_cov_39.900417_20_plen_78_part_00
MDSASNATRFLVLGRGRSPRSGADNTLLNILINHEPGALARTLTILAKVSFTRIPPARPCGVRVSGRNLCGLDMRAI